MTLPGALGAAFVAGSILTGRPVAAASDSDAPNGCPGLVHEGFTDPFPCEAGSYRLIDSAEARAAILARLGWNGSVLDLLYANVLDPQGRGERSDGLKPLGLVADDPHAKGMEACSGSQSGPEKPF